MILDDKLLDEVTARAKTSERPGGHFVQKFIVENHTVYGLN